MPATYQMLRAIQKTCCTRTLETLTLKSHLIDPFFVCVDRMNHVVYIVVSKSDGWTPTLSEFFPFNFGPALGLYTLEPIRLQQLIA